ncbi:alpha/beta hydrolase [Alteromonas oceanisediminis]|uniref:alpha/beta hydrolase n=1 Tax=Alteromonas oceanisediminis TaxID=2836180 RepID=UPI001BD93BAB|nr:alpha/beta hydrolase [Alteromonas oceanisediminis]MBT0585186.1 alpha/beta hydrolase [Alteromonas oceanisediminis]
MKLLKICRGLLASFISVLFIAHSYASSMPEFSAMPVTVKTKQFEGEDLDYYEKMKEQSNSYFASQLSASPDMVDGALLHPKLQFHLEKYSRGDEVTDYGSLLSNPESANALRAGVDANWAGRTLESKPMKKITEQTVEKDGAITTIRFYYPDSYSKDSPIPIILYFHGGGWLFGSLDSHHPFYKLLANNANVVVAAASYRLAPQFSYPAAHKDAYLAYEFVVEHANKIGVYPNKIAVGGDSAGGNLAASIAVYSIQNGLKRPDFMLLYYPSVDIHRSEDFYESGDLFATGFGLDRPFADVVLAEYYPDKTLRKDVLASPILFKDKAKMPPAIISVGGFDILRDQASLYAKQLREAGVDVDYMLYPDLVHSFQQHSFAVDSARKATLETISLFGKRIRETKGVQTDH